MAEGGHLVYSQAIPMLYSGTVMHIFWYEYESLKLIWIWKMKNLKRF
jgi:hypothetical protein